MAEEWLQISLAVSAWYLTSFGTLLLNKYLLGTAHIQPNFLALVQMVSTAIYGALKTVDFRAVLKQVYSQLSGDRRGRRKPIGMGWDMEAGEVEKKDEVISRKDARSPRARDWRRTVWQISFVGGMRFATVVLGLVSLKNIAASFTETIKASAPFFTVIIAYFMLGELTAPSVVLSLLPIAGGLVLVSSNEVSFNTIGFVAAVSTNVIECVQNVFSKRLLANEYTASQLQFYTSLTALILQAPLLIYSALADSSVAATIPTAAPGAEAIMGSVVNMTLGSTSIQTAIHRGFAADGDLPPSSHSLSTLHFLCLLWIDGVLYHLQSVVAYVVMSFLSPVTVSVVNTVKRAMLIYISVLVFGNEVTGLAKLGTAVCLAGVLAYNYLRQQQVK